MTQKEAYESQYHKLSLKFYRMSLFALYKKYI